MVPSLLAHAVVLALVVAVHSVSATARSCATKPVPQCGKSNNRDTLFLVEVADNAGPDPARFYSEMLDNVQSLYCAFSPLEENKVGLILFGAKTSITIPLAQYNQTAWFSAVEKVRADNTSCCSGGNPLANAFDLASQVFDEQSEDGAVKTVVVFTTGAAWNNPGKGLYSYPATSLAKYKYVSVPSEATALKKSGVRLIVVGITNKLGAPADFNYLSGIPDPSKDVPRKPKNYQCVVRDRKKSCASMSSPPFPIPSLPLASNLFNETQISQVASAMCVHFNTSSPVIAPTRSPVTSPTKRPTTGMPTKAPVTKRPTQPTTTTPSRAPVTNKPTTTKPSRTPTTTKPSQAPVTRKPTTIAPTKAPVSKRPTTAKPSRASVTKKPTTAPANSTTL